jgi:putative DNA primase/helicase
MDEMLTRINQLYPKCGYVQIRKYDAELWEGKEYDSKFENKSPLTQWRTTPLTFEQAEKYTNAEFRIGWIVPEGYVVVDVDNEDCESSADCIKNILTELDIKFSYNYTSRGIHFLFKDSTLSIPSDAVTKCSLGITIDHRANNKGYIILPTNDPHRKWGEWVDEVDEIPSFLKPIMIAKNQITTFIGLKEGDGRNTELFKWRTKLLQSNRLTDEEIRLALHLINTYLFASPLPENEMEASVMKERKTDVEQRANGDKVKLNVLEKENIYNVVANKISKEFDLMCIGYKNFYRFEKTYYRPLKDIELERMIHYEISQNIPQKGRNEIMSFLALKTLVDAQDIDKVWHKIAVGNGVLDVVTGELSEPDREEKNTIGIPWNYNPDPPHSPKIDEFMAHISANRDGSVNIMKEQFLYQIAGYSLLKKNYFGKFFIFQGDGGTGKSTFQDLIVKMVGEVNRSRVSIDKMDADYFLATMLGKLINIDDDAVDGKVLENTGRFKSLVTGNEITVRQIFREPVTFVPFVTCMFSCNKLPRILDKTSGLYRRMVIIELNNKVEKPDPLFLIKLSKRDMEYFLFKAVYWIGVALQEGQFRISQSEEELLRKFKCRQSSLNEYLYEQHITLKDVYKSPVLQLYNQYIAWATMNGYTKLPSVLTVKEDICVLYNVEIEYTGEEKRASQQIFNRRKEPTIIELEEVPF